MNERNMSSGHGSNNGETGSGSGAGPASVLGGWLIGEMQQLLRSTFWEMT